MILQKGLIKNTLFAAVFFAFTFMNYAAANAVQDGGYAHPESLIYVPELKELVDAGKVTLVDVRSVQSYEEGHIPGAIQITRQEFEDPDGPIEAELATPAQMNALLSAKGIANGDTLVVYGSAGSPQMPQRFWWSMKVYGHDVRILDGSYDTWAAAGYPVETGPQTRPATNYQVAPADHSRSVFRDDVLSRPADVVLLDARELAEYTGETVSSGAGKGGRIPGAVHVFYKDAVQEDGYLKPASELRAIYEAKGVTPDKTIYVYCMRGHRASHTYYVLTELLGYPNVYFYDGSWIDWSNTDLPVETGN